MKEQFLKFRDKAFELTEWEELNYDNILEKFGELIVEEYSKDTKALEIALEALRKIASFKGDNVMIAKEAIYKIERLN